MQLNEDQLAAAAAFTAFVISPDRELVISGPAGTGKTTLLKHLMQMRDTIAIQELMGQRPITTWRLTATTNKAAEVLQEATGIEATTIHSLLGLRVSNDYDSGETKIQRTQNSNVIMDTLIVVDECSMVNRELRQYITDLTLNCKIVYVGDHCQLAPVKEQLSPVFADNEPIVLNKVMRSQHTPAITALCKQLRETVETGVFRPIVGEPGVIDYLTPEQAEQEILSTFVGVDHPDARILCYTNSKVVRFNNYIRAARALPTEYTPGEWLVSNTVVTGLGPKTLAPKLRVEEEVHILETSTSEDYTITVQGNRYQLPIYLVTTPAGSFRVPQDIEEYRKLVAYLAKLKAWHPHFDLKENIADLRPRDASTVYKAQGSTYHTVFVDLADIGSCTQSPQAARMLYVACSRPTHRICFIGQLPERFRGG